MLVVISPEGQVPYQLNRAVMPSSLYGSAFTAACLTRAPFHRQNLCLRFPEYATHFPFLRAESFEAVRIRQAVFPGRRDIHTTHLILNIFLMIALQR
jgi:hypothetical protein